MVVKMNSVLPQLSTGMLTFFGWQSRLQPCPAPALASTATMTTSCILCWVQLRRLPQEGIRLRIRYWSMSERIWEGSINVWHSLETIYSILVIEPLRYQCLMLDLDQQNIFQFHLYASINLHLLETWPKWSLVCLTAGSEISIPKPGAIIVVE